LNFRKPFSDAFGGVAQDLLQARCSDLGAIQ
jgi:hypothetical protein